MTTTLISGANRSLGLETARRLIDAGHTVYAGMRDVANGDAARKLGAHIVQLDVTDPASVEAAIKQLPELDVLVNNAGILGAATSLDDLDADAMTAVLVNVASGVGWPRFLATEGHDEFPVKAIPYAASKAAVIALTVQYAKNLPGMRINVSDPGYTATDFNRHRGHQTITQGTDATVALATLSKDGPTGEFHDRAGRIHF